MAPEIWDYLAVCAVLVVPILVGVYHGVRGNANLPYSFVFGHKEIPLVKTSLSAAALAACPVILFLLPELSARHGFTWVLAGIGYVLSLVLVTIFIVPILHYSRSPSIFQYLEDRYRSRALRHVAVLIFAAVTLIFATVILSQSAELLAKTIPIRHWQLALVLGTIVAFSVVTGGLGAAIDLNSLIFPLFGIGSLAVSLGMSFLGSDDLLDSILEQELSLETEVLSQAPSIFLVIPFSFIVFLQVLGTSQVFYQNVAPAVTKRRARLTLILSTPLVVIAAVLCFLVGLMVRKTDCAISTNTFNAYISSISLWTRGLPAIRGGLIGGLAALGTAVLASSVLSIATVLWEDVFSSHFSFKKDKRQVLAVQILMTVTAAAITLSSVLSLLLIEDFERFYRQLFLLSTSFLSPVSAIFLAGMFFPCCNVKGAAMGLTVGLLATLTFGAGNLVFQEHREELCPLNQSSTLEVPSTTLSSFTREISSTINILSTTSSAPTTISSTTSSTPTTEATTVLSNETTEISLNLTEFIALQQRSALDLIITSEDKEEQVDLRVFRSNLLLHPILGLSFTVILTLLFSLMTGGQDIYALDWNLVYWTCNNCTQRLTFGGNTTLQRRRKPRLGKAPYVHSESFRYARHGPLPDSSYRNPRVSQMMVDSRTQQTTIEEDPSPEPSFLG